MSEFNITVPGGESKRLKTGGKYCPADILVTAENDFTPPTSEMLDPDEVYRTTRPADWLPMPTPGDNEIYILGHMPENLDGAFTALLKFSGGCTVEVGNLQNGVFVAKHSMALTDNKTMHYTVPNSEYGDVTKDGFKQYLIRIYGESVSSVVLSNDAETYSYGFPNLVDIVIGINCSFMAGSTQNDFDGAAFRYARFVGNATAPGDTIGFARCRNLRCVSMEKPSSAAARAYWFYNCRQLVSVSGNIFYSATDVRLAFQASSIFAVPVFRSKQVSAYSVFRESSIFKIDGNEFDTSEAPDFTYFLYSAATREALNINVSKMTGAARPFEALGLFRFTFAGETTPGGWTLNFTAAKFSHAALMEMIASLPTATAAATITITGVPGASELTDDEIAVATAKNWTITI